MQLDILLTSNAQTDTLQPGKTAARTDRCGASLSRYKTADSEDAASFDTALEGARARHETAGSPSPDDNPSAVDVSPDMEPASDPAADNTESQLASASLPSSKGVLSTGGLKGDAAKTTPASPGEFDPKVAVAAHQDGEKPAVDTAETGNETKVFQGAGTEKVDSQASTAKAPAPATTALATSAEVAINATMTDAAVKTTSARSEKNRHQNRVEKDAGGLTEKWSTLSPSANGRGDSASTARVGGFASVFNASQSGDDLLQKFGHGAGRDVEGCRSEPQATEKGAERPSWSSSALKTADGGLQESTNVTSAKTGTESEQKVADMLLTPQRAVNGAGEAAAAAKAGEAHHPKEPHADTLGQIVDKAVFRLRNGRSEVRIDLKPDSLGHVKLQIVTENHQVTLRIMAESHAAKNLIDSGIGQLKTDLQAQGLRVDELEVSVANEFNDLNRHSAFSDDAAQARDLPSTGRQAFQETVPVASLKPAMENRATAGVDCFV
jgi:flagellar hook-length control protein FliK